MYGECINKDKCEWYWCKHHQKCFLHEQEGGYKAQMPQFVVVKINVNKQKKVKSDSIKKWATAPPYRSLIGGHINTARGYPLFEFETKDTECFYCNKSIKRFDTGGDCLTRDHVYPKSKGGRLIIGNWVYACARCNGLKGNLTLQKFKQKLESLYTHYKQDYYKKVLSTVTYMIEKLYPTQK